MNPSFLNIKNHTTIMRLTKPSGEVVGTMSTAKSSKQTPKPKKLRYNFKQISSRILAAKTSGSAGQVVIMARNNLAQLRRKLKSEDYNDEELMSAIAHAEKMVRIAKKRQRHLQEEERAKQNCGQTADGDLLDKTQKKGDAAPDKDAFDLTDSKAQASQMSREEMLLQIQKLQELLEKSADLMEETMEENAKALDDELSEAFLSAPSKMSPADLESLKKKHRTDEMREIMEADMKYLKALFDQLQKEKDGGGSAGFFSADCGVSLQIGAQEMPLPTPEISVPEEGGSFDISV